MAGARTLLTVPMLKEGTIVGALGIYRQEVRPFTYKQIKLLQSFANQAVIAIENARLLKELRESLEQQTATSEVLSVISSSPGDLQPVFEKMLENATRVCHAEFGIMHLRAEGDLFRHAALHNVPAAFAEQVQRDPVIRDMSGSALERLVQTKQPFHIEDVHLGPGYLAGNESVRNFADLTGARTVAFVPMIKDGEVIGSLGIYRCEVRRFADKQVELLGNFAKQAVIAIENARLLNELRESLEQQTATSQVLGVISSSPGELEPVFNTILENATRICDAGFGTLLSYDGEAFRNIALYNVPPAFAEQDHGNPFVPPSDAPLGRFRETKQPIHVADLRTEPAYKRGFAPIVMMTDGAGARSILAVPMLKDTALVGGIAIYRQEVRPFTEKQIEVVSNFASQAVIAIENTRLLNELRESLEQQTATSEVLRVISSSPGELEAVFDSILENATRICEAKVGNLFLREGDDFRAVSVHGDSGFASESRRQPIASLREYPTAPLARLLKTNQLVQVPDLQHDRSYLDGNPRIVSLVETAGARTLVVVPMLKDRNLVGAISIYRREVRPFTGKQIALVQNFAAQAVIAIENARLLSELRESLQQQTATADVLKVISRSTFNLQTVLDTLVGSAARLCGAPHGLIFRFDGTSARSQSLDISQL
jgi:GAF domain-containing protein